MVFAFEVTAKLPFFPTQINPLKRGFGYPLKEGGREARGKKLEARRGLLRIFIWIYLYLIFSIRLPHAISLCSLNLNAVPYLSYLLSMSFYDPIVAYVLKSLRSTRAAGAP